MRENDALKLKEERLNQQVAEMQLRIDALEVENSELKTKRANNRSLLISDIMLEISLWNRCRCSICSGLLSPSRRETGSRR